MSIDLYILNFSPPCRTVQMVAKQLNIDLNLINIDFLNGEHLSPEFKKLNPAQCIPTINDNGFLLSESRAISRYLCNKYAPDSQLYPKEPTIRARVDRMLDFDIGSLVPSVRYGLVEPMRSSEATEEQINTMKKNLEVLDLFLGDYDYVAANHLTIADISILSYATIFIAVDYELTSYPNLNRWLNKLQTELTYFDEINRKVIEDLPALMKQIRESNANKN